MIGALALVAAGLGSTAFSSTADRGALQADYQSISAAYTGDDAASQVSRSLDREKLERDGRIQAEQKLRAQAETRQRVQQASAQIRANQWVLPVTGYQLTARFGQSSGLWATVHTGLDFAGPSGSTIVSVAAGTVKETGYAGAYGNRTIITLDDGTDVWYCHQSRIVVEPGQKVGPGDVIGYTGSTGNVTGPHLHFEVHPDGGAAVDPEPVLREHDVNP